MLGWCNGIHRGNLETAGFLRNTFCAADLVSVRTKKVKTYPALITKQRKSLASDEYSYHRRIQINKLRKTETSGKME